VIVRRSYHHVKPGKGNMDKAVALVKELAAGWQHPVRVYVSLAGPDFGTLAAEAEAESMAEWEKFAAEFNASAQGKVWYERWGEVTGEGHAEFWELR
jgi:hypothetical protein